MERGGGMAANRESIFQPHSFTPSINNRDVAGFWSFRASGGLKLCDLLFVCI